MIFGKDRSSTARLAFHRDCEFEVTAAKLHHGLLPLHFFTGNSQLVRGTYDEFGKSVPRTCDGLGFNRGPYLARGASKAKPGCPVAEPWEPMARRGRPSPGQRTGGSAS